MDRRAWLLACALGVVGCHGDSPGAGPRDDWQRENFTAIFGSTRDSRVAPRFGSTVRAADPPPPLSGGTLVVGRDGVTAVAADPDRDRVYVVDLGTRKLRGTLLLQHHDEPGRIVEGPDGTFFVALRHAGAVVRLDAATVTARARRPVCAAPRGLAFDATAGLVHVACAGGEFVSLRVSDGSVARSLQLAPDLRDVVIDGTRLLVTRFRSAEVLEIGSDGQSTLYSAPRVETDAGEPQRDATLADDAAAPSDAAPSRVPSVAWRAVAVPQGGLLMTHQLASTRPVDDSPGIDAGFRPVEGPAGYTNGGGCGAIVATAVTKIVDGMPFTTGGTLLGAVLPVDIAVAHRADRVVVVAAGNARIPEAPLLYTLHHAALMPPGGSTTCGLDNEIMTQPNAQPIAAAFDGSDALIVQTREPTALYLVDQHVVIRLADDSREDTGRAVFHSNSGGNLACASCHPEGGDDGRIWNFTVAGRRRTQNLRGGVLATAPFHWGGEFPTVEGLMAEVFHHRMGGPALDDGQNAALAGWIDKIAPLPRQAPRDLAAVERGRQLFHDAVVGCAACHSGAQGTNNATVSVGTGGAFQVPRLVGVAQRGPYMHNGCALTLRDRFGPCGGGDLHGHTSQLTPAAIDDLLRYLETL